MLAYLSLETTNLYLYFNEGKRYEGTNKKEAILIWFLENLNKKKNNYWSHISGKLGLLVIIPTKKKIQIKKQIKY